MFFFVFEPIILRFYGLKKSAKQADKGMAENIETFQENDEEVSNYNSQKKMDIIQPFELEKQR